MAYGAVNCVVIFCRILADAMCSTFYPSYNDTAFSMGRDHIVVWLTPVLRLHQNLYEVYNNGSGPLLSAGTWKSLLVYGIAALVLLAASALLYRIRRSEASGDTLAFRPLRRWCGGWWASWAAWAWALCWRGYSAAPKTPRPCWPAS